MKALDLWLPYVTLENYTAPALIMRQAVLDTAIDFCERTKCWQDNQLYDVATALDYAFQSTSQWIVHEARSGNLPDRSAIAYKSPLWLDENYPGWRIGADPGRPAYLTALQPDRFYLVPAPSQAYVLSLLVALKPTRTAIVVPDLLYTHFFDTIAIGAKGRLHAMSGAAVTWGDAGKAQAELAEYDGEVDKATRRVEKGFGRGHNRTKASFL